LVPLAGWYFPATQCAHATEPVDTAKLPAAHVSQLPMLDAA
jgi:hypothetical protein